MEKINFVLPGFSKKPIGGYKVVFQYANELVKRGYDVTISFTFYDFANMDQQGIPLINKRIKEGIKKFLNKKIEWFELNEKIDLKFGCFTNKDFIDADYIFATAASTAKLVHGLNPSKGKKLYFIQNFETWYFDGSVEELNKTYTLGLNNIVISNELKQKVLDAGAPEPSYLPNFYDHEEFYLVNAIDNRRNSVALINHTQETKRTKFGLAVLADVKKEIPDLEVELFGAYDPVEKLPDYVNFTHMATSKQLRETIFGNSKIYLMPSVREGWVLTGMEAMASGATVVASRIGGIVDYAKDSNSILVEPDNKAEFVQKLTSLLKDDEQRIKIGKLALQDVQQYTIEKSGDLLVDILNKAK